MKLQPILIVLTLVNLGLFTWQLTGARTADAASGDGIIRGRGIEILDANGIMRAQIKVEPANADYVMPDGTKGYPETVIFRLITSDGKPRVKITTSEEASGLMLLGDSDTTHTILQADRKETSLKLRNSETVEEILKP
ncbi:MAG: hypothetical protein HYV27_07415 [Candidatus Hydrogenedentes bacterium]|nr:hypothetical protein [Candidatus Hydrogenedentota bacterium]